MPFHKTNRRGAYTSHENTGNSVPSTCAVTHQSSTSRVPEEVNTGEFPTAPLQQAPLSDTESCRTTGRRASVVALTSRTAASAAAASYTACGPRPESTHSCAKKLSRNQQATFQPLTSPFIPYGVPLAHGRCACALPRAAGLSVRLGRRHGEGRPRQLLWLLLGRLLLHSLRDLPGASRIGEGTRPCEQMFSD